MGPRQSTLRKYENMNTLDASQWKEALNIACALITEDETYKMCKALKKIVLNLHRSADKYRVLYTSNKILWNRILKHGGGVDLLTLIGFTELKQGSGELRLTKTLPTKSINAAVEALEEKLQLLEPKQKHAKKASRQIDSISKIQNRPRHMNELNIMPVNSVNNKVRDDSFEVRVSNVSSRCNSPLPRQESAIEPE